MASEAKKLALLRILEILQINMSVANNITSEKPIHHYLQTINFMI